MKKLNLILLAGAAAVAAEVRADFGSFAKGIAGQAASAALQDAKAPPMKVKMAEVYVKNAEKGGATARSALKEARQRVDELKKSYADDPSVADLDRRLVAAEEKERAAAEAKAAAYKAKVEKEEAERKAFEAHADAVNKATQDRLDARKAEAAAEAAAQAQTIGRTAALPWVMEQPGRIYSQEREKKFDEYIAKLGTAKKDDVVALVNQLKARAEEDRKIVKANATGWNKAQEELDCYDEFLSRMWDNVLRLNFDGKADVAANTIQLNSYRIPVPTASVLLMWCERDKLYCFSDPDSKESDYVYDDKAVNAIKFHLNTLYFISCFCYGQEDQGHKKTYGVSRFLVEKISEALKNNTKDRMTYHPRPTAGAMHKEFGKEALALAQAHEYFQGATEAIVCSDDWFVDHDRLGNITRRRIEGWVLKPTDPGTRLLPAKWDQPYQGGGKYGKLKLSTYGGRRYWVK